VLNKAEFDSRTSSVREVRQAAHHRSRDHAGHRADPDPPAALLHQARVAAAVSTTEAAGVKCNDTLQSLGEFVNLISRFREALGVLERTVAHHDEDRSGTRPGSATR